MLEYSKGKLFPQAFINGSYVFILFSPYFLINELWMGVVVLILGVGIAFSTEGIIIDGDAKRFREFSKYLVFKVGKWQSLDSHPFLTLMPITEDERAYFMKKSSDIAERYGVFLVNASRTQKVLISKFEDKDAAIKEMELIVSKTGLKVV